MSFALKHAMRKRMAKGGMVDENKPEYSANPAENYAEFEKSHPQYQGAKIPKEALRDIINYHKNLPEGETKLYGPGYAKGGMVDRVMAKKYSKGGMVANDDEPIADEMPAQYDDLALRDDLEEHYTGANSGDELGDAQEDHDRADIIARIMKSRAKRDKMPRPA